MSRESLAHACRSHPRNAGQTCYFNRSKGVNDRF